ncbi:MAG TPA: 4-(cytidine 5'-diphospho)-2-C-methyl-D-erythritol kinase [Dinghuibacter sp.]|uniref:4-(cytidine 5'-diphospho)-2-C-methyl-D-erythritol kinase n=1 Tax=Dinghuibacter sp. TaxID=2024697 RepID=UPI002B581E3F|nr:4-(cytidine 5'-diphospho)-2-C-methyl-D-erythritol kinase [Dinghuibacter sp.]HTJ10934.1 4-(cytidine 5'-diphospho)-2-C-methyl-D-erythritol kinase [Dinghuibacter sp.]
MILFPPCKINLGLRILSKRPDGFHDLETLFYPVGLRDAIEMLPASSVSLHVSGASIPGDPLTNLCVKAYELLAADFPAVRPVDIYLHKRIPTGAGLGGGSSDGASALLLLNRLFRLGLSREVLVAYAARLGSDCPFFIYDSPCFATGRGEVLTPVALDMSGYELVLVNPGIHVPTAWAFGQLARESGPEPGVGDGAVPPVAEWRDRLVNDFEAPVFTAYPAIGRIKEQLYAAGAVYASMSGSGSTVFGWFRRGQVPPLDFPAAYGVFTG